MPALLILLRDAVAGEVPRLGEALPCDPDKVQFEAGIGPCGLHGDKKETSEVSNGDLVRPDGCTIPFVGIMI